MLEGISILHCKYVNIMEYGTVFWLLNLLWLHYFISTIIYIIFDDCLFFQTESNGEAAANGSTVASDKKTD